MMPDSPALSSASVRGDAGEIFAPSSSLLTLICIMGSVSVPAVEHVKVRVS